MRYKWFETNFMSQKNLTYIVALMSLALIGLVVLQFYWLNTALLLSEERFRDSIQDLLDKVVKRLEKREILTATKENIKDRVKVDSKFFVKFDSTGNARWKEDQVITTQQILSNNDLSKDGMAIEVLEEATISKSGVAWNIKGNDNFKLNLEKERLNFLTDSTTVFDSMAYVKNLQMQNYLKIINKSEMVEIVLKSMINFDKPINERITKNLLDSMIRLELKTKNIDIAYDFGVVDTKKYQLFFVNELADKVELLRSGFRTRLFPNDDFAPESYLYLRFPEQKQFILQKMSEMLISSIVLLLIISGCFAVTIFTIIQQKKLSEMKNDFINNMTHEFKTPVATISLACEAMQDPDIQENKTIMERYLQMIKEENNRLGLQVEKVLQIAQLDKGNFRLKIQSTDAEEIIKKAIQNIEIQILSKNGKITTNFQADQKLIEADQMHLTNIVNNLLDNANKYSNNSPQIHVKTENVKKGIIIAISDQGQGIAKDRIGKVFEKFYRVPTGNVHNVKGFGLGLSYVKTMVDAHYGNISVISEPNKGSIFTIFLPYRHERD